MVRFDLEEDEVDGHVTVRKGQRSSVSGKQAKKQFTRVFGTSGLWQLSKQWEERDG